MDQELFGLFSLCEANELVQLAGCLSVSFTCLPVGEN